MESLMKAMLDKLPSWSYQLFAVVIAAGLVFYFIKTLYINKKFTEVVHEVLHREDRLQSLQVRVDELQTVGLKTEHASQQTLSALRNIKPFVETLNGLRALDDPYTVLHESAFLLQRMLDMLAVDMKCSPGGHHRCGIWVYEEPFVTLHLASAGFPKHYVDTRQLHIDRSVVGRSFRKQMTVQSADVLKDEDWERNPESKSPYRALICIPLGAFGALTIDGLEAFNESSAVIGELYAAVFTGIMTERQAALGRFGEDRGGPASADLA
ncbi:GAF domain-containing protein [Paenibacillus profundus]|uniref:GAF domain-containing protein n=1 Tax=Paenibacillus profundus TaxID=1173085 RepID=A0ABS8Y9M2_9BACL|nr:MULTISPECIES: GAF domain-containing protein [Paenibacillus]MCE5167987.1 GAF domain-containing protein [Paenibacillus profundus]